MFASKLENEIEGYSVQQVSIKKIHQSLNNDSERNTKITFQKIETNRAQVDNNKPQRISSSICLYSYLV